MQTPEPLPDPGQAHPAEQRRHLAAASTARERRLGVGILGTGTIARLRHLPGYQRSVVADVVAVYDPVRQAAEALAESCGAVVCETPEQLLERTDVQAVSICTPNVYHAPLSLAALRAGKHVLCEKPLGMTYAETVEMARIAADAHRTTAVNFRYRYLPAVQLLKRQVDAGDYGRPYHLLFHYLQGTLIDPATPISWRLSRSQSGSGSLGDLAAHGIDLVRFLFGEVSAVFAELTTFVPSRPTRDGGTAVVDVDDAATLLLRMRNGALATVEATRNVGGRGNYQRLDLAGSRGSSWYEMDRADAGSETLHTWWQGDSAFTDQSVPPDLPRSNVEVIARFATAAFDGRMVSPSFVDGMHCQEVIEAALLSAERGAWVQLPLLAASGLSASEGLRAALADQ